MRGSFSLESFDMTKVADPGPSQDYHDGYAAGFEAATDAANADADRLSQDLVQSLTDMTFTYREAQRDVMESYGSLVTALVDFVLPQCVKLGITQQIADLVMARHAADQGDAIIVHVHPAQLRPVREATAAIGARVSVVADATLTPHAAWIGQAAGDTYLDMDRCLADIAQILSSLQHQNHRISENG
ncbi:hypothetical protein [Yoonia vestfoldensis]|uniref:hypothetical protein n=1 Tax=Yoonia vestfoldensis TaxID=245188 RepID=UPI00036853B1|nr:hypothetical protein [Yoonia vestfoldensis]